MQMQLPTDVRIERIDAFKDNYIWMLRRGQQVALVDPGDARPVFAVLQAHDLTPVAILVTHHHGDHVGGVTELQRPFRIPVFGPAAEPIPSRTNALHGNDEIEIPELRLRFRVLDTPGHTRAAVSYVGHGVMFCGDTLFCGGCGRLFEGTATQLYESLQSLARLPPSTLVYCAHEYTLANLQFAQAVEPDNTALKTRLSTIRAQRAAGLPTVPSTLADELVTNPFLRCDQVSVRTRVEGQTATRLASAPEIFAAVRRWKDDFQSPV
jgi:hydroxyacylglutathione hydrolase